jgi:polar amino acid transport system substrate-binding protein
MARVSGFGRLLCATIAVVWAFGGRASPAESLQFVTGVYLGPTGHLTDDEAPGPGLEVVRQVFAAMRQDISIESFPPNRAWTMVVRGERDGVVTVLRTSERELICAFPDEPTTETRWVLFVRTTDVGKLKFSSPDDLIGHDVAVPGALPGSFEQPYVSPELRQFLREHHNIVETTGVAQGFRMLAAGRVDYAVSDLAYGRRDIARMGLSGTIEPMLSGSLSQAGIYVCFSKARVSPAFVDAFSRALKQFKQTEAYRVIYRKYFQ